MRVYYAAGNKLAHIAILKKYEVTDTDQVELLATNMATFYVINGVELDWKATASIHGEVMNRLEELRADRPFGD